MQSSKKSGSAVRGDSIVRCGALSAGVLALATGGLLAGCAGVERKAQGQAPVIEAHVKKMLAVDNLKFRDSNGNGRLDPYEDWRLPVEARVKDLVSQMTLEERAGMMLIDTLNAGWEGKVEAGPFTNVDDYVNKQKMTRFIFRNAVDPNPVKKDESKVGWGGQPVTPEQAASWMNAVQETAERTRLGIPALFKSNARNHYERDARVGINSSAGSFSEWPKEAGLAATRDLDLIAEFGRTMGAEWRAIGLRGMYGYMADLATEPRWYRVHETFTEDADLNARIMTTLVQNLQGGPLNPDSPVAMTLKHFPGGGPQENGADPHYTFGKNQVYPGGRFVDHFKPFKAAIDAGVSSIMPYYGVPISLSYNGVKYDQVGMAFSRQIVTDLLRGELGFKGYVNSDTGIIKDRAWGLEGKTEEEKIAAAVNGGTDVLSGYHENARIVKMVQAGQLSTARVDEAAARLLKEQFLLGLFENPYVDARKAASVVGNDAFRARAMEAQRKSIVLLQNREQALPLPAPSAARPVRLYTMGMNAAVVGDRQYGYSVVSGDYKAGETRPAVPADTDYALIRVEVSNVVPADYKGDPIDLRLVFGGSTPEDMNKLAFSEMASAKSWKISPSLKDIQDVMKAVGPKKTILSIYFRQPYVLDEASGLREAGGIVAGFGVSDAALMDVLSGRFKPQGKLPFALASNAQAIVTQDPDAAGYAAKDTLYPFGHGLGY